MSVVCESCPVITTGLGWELKCSTVSDVILKTTKWLDSVRMSLFHESYNVMNADNKTDKLCFKEVQVLQLMDKIDKNVECENRVATLYQNQAKRSGERVHYMKELKDNLEVYIRNLSINKRTGGEGGGASSSSTVSRVDAIQSMKESNLSLTDKSSDTDVTSSHVEKALATVTKKTRISSKLKRSHSDHYDSTAETIVDLRETNSDIEDDSSPSSDTEQSSPANDADDTGNDEEQLQLAVIEKVDDDAAATSTALVPLSSSEPTPSLPSPPTKHYCVICNEEFTNKKSLPAHLLQVHGVKSFSCDKCNKRFAYRHSMELHVQNFHEKRFTCEVCDKRFSFRHSMVRHLLDNHGITEKESKRKRVTTGDEKKFKHKCDICCRRFTCKYSLVNHMENHEKLLDSVKWKCTVCPKEFTRKDTLKRHMLVHDQLPALT